MLDWDAVKLLVSTYSHLLVLVVVFIVNEFGPGKELVPLLAKIV